MASIGLVYNPRAGAGATEKELVGACAAQGLEVEACALSRQINAQFFDLRGWTTVIAAGGDGTIRAVANELIGSERTLGVIPAGTLNHFAKDAGIPTDISEAIAIIVAGHSKRVDTASVNGQGFLNNSSLGLYPSLVRHRDDLAGQIGKWPAALFGLAKSVAQRRTYRLQVSIDGQVAEFVTPFVFVGNNSYGIDQLGISNRQSLAGGKLCMYVVKSTSILELAKLSCKALIGNIDQEPSFESHEGSDLVITALRRELAVALDGEVIELAPPLYYEIKPLSLSVIVPR